MTTATPSTELTFCSAEGCTGTELPSYYAIGKDGRCDGCRWRKEEPRKPTLIERVREALAI